MLDIGVEQAKGGKQARRRRHNDAPHVQRLGHARGEQRPIAAKGKQRIVARVTATLGGHRLDGTHHVRGGDLMRAIGRMRQRQTERLRNRRLEDLPRLVGIQRQGAPTR